MHEGISRYLEKYRELLVRYTTNTTGILRVFQREIDQNIQERDLQIKHGKILFTGHPVIKHRIFQKKEILLQELRNSGIRGITDIS